MFCPECGKENVPAAKKCDNCGYQLSYVASAKKASSYIKVWSAQRRKDRLKAGLCVICGKNKIDKKSKSCCRTCLDKAKKREADKKK